MSKFSNMVNTWKRDRQRDYREGLNSDRNSGTKSFTSAFNAARAAEIASLQEVRVVSLLFCSPSDIIVHFPFCCVTSKGHSHSAGDFEQCTGRTVCW